MRKTIERRMNFFDDYVVQRVHCTISSIQIFGVSLIDSKTSVKLPGTTST